MIKGIACATRMHATAGLLSCTTSVNTQMGPPPPDPPPPPAAPPPAPLPDYITISDRIQFETGNAVLLPQSYPILNEVVEVLKKNPQITLIEIGGHTDSVGDEHENLLLSQQRAESVRTYLVSQGIAFNRMRAMGYGERVPVASNDDEHGRLQNRRVEFRIVKQPGQ